MYEHRPAPGLSAEPHRAGHPDGQITRSEAFASSRVSGRSTAPSAARAADGRGDPAGARPHRPHDRPRGPQIYRQSHDSQQAWDRGQNWGRTDGRATAGTTYAGATTMAAGISGNGGGQSRSQLAATGGGDHGNHYGWTSGQHNGWDGNRPPGSERRDAWNDDRIANRRARHLADERRADNRMAARTASTAAGTSARSDGRVSPYDARPRRPDAERPEPSGICDGRQQRMRTGSPTAGPRGHAVDATMAAGGCRQASRHAARRRANSSLSRTGAAAARLRAGERARTDGAGDGPSTPTRHVGDRTRRRRARAAYAQPSLDLHGLRVMGRAVYVGASS